MFFKMRKRLKKAFLLVCVGMLAVCSLAFSVSADEVIFNGTLTFDVDANAYIFPSYISLTVGDTYSLTYNGVTDTAQVNPPADDVPASFAFFYNIGCIFASGDIGMGDQTIIGWQAEEPPATIDIILSKASGSDLIQDQVFGTVTEILSAVIGWVGQVGIMFTQTPLFLVGLLVFFVIGGSVWALKRSF